MNANLTDDESPITVNTISFIEMESPLTSEGETMVEMMSLPSLIKSLEQLYQTTSQQAKEQDESKRLVKRQAGINKMQGINPRNVPRYILKNKLGPSMLAAAFGMPKQKGAHGHSNPFGRHKREASKYPDIRPRFSIKIFY